MKRKIYREDIINAGKDLMYEHGYNATAIKDITDRVQIPKGSFYNHFSSKEEFGITVLKEYCEKGLDFHREILLDIALSPLQRIDKFYADMIKKYDEVMKYKLGCIMSNFSAEMADVNENFRVVLDTSFSDMEKVIVKCLEEAKKCGELSRDFDSELFGSFMINSWHGAIVRMKSTGNSKPLTDFKKAVFQHFNANPARS